MPAFRRPSSSPLVLLRGLLADPLALRTTLRMPGRFHKGPLPPLTAAQASLAGRLRQDVEHVAGNIGERNVFTPDKLAAAELWLGSRLQKLGHRVNRQAYTVGAVECANVWIDLPGRSSSDEIVVIGSHYDSVHNCPAANDNGSGVAAVLHLAAHFASLPDAARPARTLRFVFFANEEPPHFWTENMGSLVFARACRAKAEKIVAMITPETIGCYLDEPGSQRYPIPLGGWYPTTGDFIAFIGLADSGALVQQCVGAFRAAAAFPSIGAALPGIIPGVGSSDHWSFARVGYPALMITDTAPFRYRYYHTPQDTPDKMDFERMGRVVEGLEGVVLDLARGPDQDRS